MYFSREPAAPVVAGQPVTLRFQPESGDAFSAWQFYVNDEHDKPIALDPDGTTVLQKEDIDELPFEHVVVFPEPGIYRVYGGPLNFGEGDERKEMLEWIIVETPQEPPVLQVALVSEPPARSGQQDLWVFIRDVTDRLRFKNFVEFAKADQSGASSVYLGKEPAYGSLTYERLHELSKEFVTKTALGGRPARNAIPVARSATTTADPADLSYVHGIAEINDLAAPYPYGIVDDRYPLDRVPFVELIFVYWIEEAMVFQTLNHIVARFQNRRPGGAYDPLARLSVNPLQPLRGILWGLSDAEQDRLSVRRRCAEYEYQYGLRLIGRAIPPAEMVVERRTQFLETFHSLLHASYRFYKERDDKTVDADPFPLLSSLRELHLVLAMGAHNQFADLPLIARNEIIDVQWMLAQPEMREFLGGPTMVPYEEPWMDRVDTMKTLQGWSDVSVTQFYDLAFHGEQLLLSVRHGRWNESTRNDQDADNWAMAWRNSVQRYIYAYRAVTGVDLSQRMDSTMPSTLLARRLAKKLARS